VGTDSHARGRLITVVVSAVLVCLALWSAGLSPARLASALESWWSKPERGQEATAAADRPATAPQVVQATPPVVTAGQPLPGTDSSASAVPKPLVLVSTAPGRNPSEGTARIGTEPRNPQTYSGGAILANGARLTEIHADHVVLERNRQRMLLYIGKSAASSDLTMVGGAARSPAVTHFAEDRLVDVIRHMPYYRDEVFAGLQVFPGRHAGVFAQLGLKAGDVIVAIDGAPLGDGEGGVEMLRTLTEGAAMTVTVHRGGQAMGVALDGTIMPAAQAVSTTYETPGPLTQ
jgi:hypothetical protein